MPTPIRHNESITPVIIKKCFLIKFITLVSFCKIFRVYVNYYPLAQLWYLLPRAVRLPEGRAVRFSGWRNVNNAVNGVGVVYQSVVAPCHVYGEFSPVTYGTFSREHIINRVRDAEQFNVAALHCKYGRKYKGRVLFNNDVTAKVLQSYERGFYRVGVSFVYCC